MAKDTKYFSHDYNARTDVKIKKLIQKKGIAGYGIFWAIVEDLYNNANALPLDYESIALDLRTDEDIIESVINDFGLFIIEDGYFYSSSVAERLKIMDAKSKKNSESANIRWEKERAKYANALQTECDRNAIKKEIKEIKEIKRNEKENEKEKIEPLTFAQCIERMKTDEKLKEDQVFCNKISLSDYLEYLEIFARTKKTQNERERVDYSDKRQHFMNWVGSYKQTFERNRGKNTTPEIKVNISDETKSKLSQLYSSQNALMFFERYMREYNKDEVQALNDFKQAKSQSIPFLTIQSRISNKELIYKS